MNNEIAILLSTFNGEKYLSFQIESILNQTYDNWHLFIRDDCSNDDTMNIIKVFTNKYPNKIFVIDNMSTNLGVIKSFDTLLQYAKEKNYKYFMFCDQDDYWMNDKIEITYKTMQLKENRENKPILIHSDLMVVNDDMEIIDDSFIKSQKLNPNKKTINYMLVQNNITGNTMMINKQLANLIESIPHDCIMHDWWIGLTASVYGNIYFIDKPLVKYRQHSDNVIGAVNKKGISYIINKLKDKENNVISITNTIKQAGLWINTFNDVDTYSKNVIHNYSMCKTKSYIGKLYIIFKYKLFKNNLLNTIGELIFLKDVN